MDEDNNVFGEVIYSYTRNQAIEDGVLVDVTKLAREVGWVTPVALTRTVWDRYVKVPDGVVGQDVTGRLWDVLWMCRMQAHSLCGGEPEMLFTLHVRNDNREGTPPLVTLKAHCGWDDRVAVVTIMLLGAREKLPTLTRLK
jgi:hypothetical protein